MPYQTPSTSNYIYMKKVLVRNGTPIDTRKLRAPLPYNNFYNAYLTIKNVLGNGVKTHKP